MTSLEIRGLGRPLLFAALLGMFAALSSGGAEALRTYTVVLKEPSVGRRLSPRVRALSGRVTLNEAEIKAISQEVQLSQEPVKTALRALGLEVIGSATHTLNAVFVRATRSQIAQIRQMSGVQRVVRSPRFKRMLNEAAEIVGAPAAWSAAGGIENAGSGLKIGIIDSGIDPDHPALQDPSLAPPPGFPKGRPADLAFTSNKVIVARSYVGLLSPSDPAFSRPDDTSPRDRVGHGTAVATIAAGRRVEAPAATLTGIAPKAFLGNYKIFGSPDINDLSDASAVISAMDDAVIDGMDIISISFGAIAQFPYDAQGDFCSDDPAALCDPVAQAAQSAMEDFGVIVVAAAGNGGAFGEQHFPAQNTIATPGSAPAVITVGATLNSRQFTQRVRFGGHTVTALSGTGPELESPLTAPATDATALGNGPACDPFAPESLDGRIALVARGSCDFEVKVENAAAAGAFAVIVANLEGADDPFIMAGLETTGIPAFMIGGAAGTDLGNLLAAAPETPVTLDPALVPREFTPEQIAPFSSRGPSPSNDIKPELVAPGTFIYAGAQRFDTNGDTFDPAGYTSVDGTSFAAPMVAGAAALVKQRHPEFSPAQVKSALVNTASIEVFENGRLARFTSMGAGLLDIPAALDPIATVEPATVSFGSVNNTALPIQRTLAITNTGASAGTFQVTAELLDPDPNADVRIEGVTQRSAFLRRGETWTLGVELRGSTPSPGQYEGFIRVQKESGGVDLLIPYYYVVGDGVPHNSFAIAGAGVVGTINEPHPEFLIFRVIDRHGQPVGGLDVTFRVVDGGGSIFAADPATDPFGVAAADVDMGPETGFQDFEAVAGGLVIPFLNAARLKPRIDAIVNAAGFLETPLAPGSIVTVFGEHLAEFEGSASNLPLPLALKHVSVSFDFPEENLSVPGRLFFVHPRQLNIQAPWELAGLNFALVKVRIEDSVSDVFTLDLSDYSPGIFDFEQNGRLQSVVTHLDGSLVTPEHPARSGETLVVYATGLGPVTAPQLTGEPAPHANLAWTRSTPAVRIAGREAAVTFSGLVPGLVGLYQLNVTLPPTLPGGSQELTVTSNGIASNRVSIWIQ